MLSIVWILIVSVLIIKDLIIYNTFLDKKIEAEIPSNLYTLLEKCKSKLNINKDIKLVLQSKVKTPSLYGIFKPKILLTNEILNLSLEELECIFLHELNHYKNNHHIVYLFLHLLQQIYFFNPFMQFAFKKIRQDLEMITDDLVLGAGIKKKSYLKALINSMEVSCFSDYPIPSICTEKVEIERRIMNMKNKIIDTKFASIFIILVISLISLVTISLASEKVDNNKYFIEENGMNEGSEFSDSVDENIVQNSKMSDETFESIEFIKPLENPKVTALFGERIHPITDETIFHSGIDIVSSDSDIVMAAADGSIIFTGYDASKGLHVEIEHADGSISSYAHGSEIYVEVGDEVKAGEKIMKVGSTGMSTGPHLHFEVQNSDGEYVDINSMFD